MGTQGGVARRRSCFFRWDLYPFLGAFDNITFGVPPPEPLTGDGDGAAKKDGDPISVGAIVGIVVATIVLLQLLALAFAFHRRRKSYREIDFQSGDDITTIHSLQFDFKTIEAATDKFSKSNRLGQGGFGDVYKGILPNGTEVAVKRLSKTSGQGAQEFKTEAVLVAKLQHINLVRLLGFCLEGDEKILVYEFVPNKSLDYLLFDPKKQGHLDWTTRYKIIMGIARGILYLHQDSRLTIIHRDLKASNILLDADMNPKLQILALPGLLGLTKPWTIQTELLEHMVICLLSTQCMANTPQNPMSIVLGSWFLRSFMASGIAVATWSHMHGGFGEMGHH